MTENQNKKLQAAKEAGLDVNGVGADCILEDQSGGLTASGPEDRTFTESTDYAAASWNPAAYNNYSRGRSQRVTKLVVHTVQGSFASCINWFKNEIADVSAHYVVSTGGAVTQMVRDFDTGWHAGYSNPISIGVEHEGYIDDGKPPSEAMLLSSARLFAHLCKKYGLNPDTAIVGHRDLPRQTHTDPGNEWPMTRFKSMVKSILRGGSGGGGTKPPGIGAPAWVNFAHASEKDKGVANAAVAGLKHAGFTKVGATSNVRKAVDDALKAPLGKYPCIVVGSPALEKLTLATEGKLFDSRGVWWPTSKSDVWDGEGSTLANTEDKVAWRIKLICDRAGKNADKALTKYRLSLPKA